MRHSEHLDQIPEKEDFIPCELPEGLDWFLPMKKIASKEGGPIYIDQQGRHLTRDQYILIHHLDPEIAQEKMKYHIGVYLKDNRCETRGNSEGNGNSPNAICVGGQELIVSRIDLK